VIADFLVHLAIQAWKDGKAEGESVDWSALQVHPDNVGRLEMMENKALKESLALGDKLVKLDHRGLLVIADFLVQMANQAWKGRRVERESVDWLAIQVHRDNMESLDMMESKALQESLALRDKLVNLDHRGPLVFADLLVQMASQA